MDMTLDQAPATRDSAGIDKEHQVQIGMLDAFSTLIENGEPQLKVQEMFKISKK